MSFREALFIDKLVPGAKETFARLILKRRDYVLGNSPVVFRVRKYKQAGEIRDERVSVVKPQIHRVKLWSLTLKKFVQIKTTPQMLRLIESCGGLDDYLLRTPDRLLKSDMASSLRWTIMQARTAAGQSLAPGLPTPSLPPSDTEDASSSAAAGAAAAHQAAAATTTTAPLPGARPLSPGAAAVLHAKEHLEATRTAEAVRSFAAAARPVWGTQAAAAAVHGMRGGL